MLFRSLLLSGMAVNILCAPVPDIDAMTATQDMTALQVTWDKIFTAIDKTILNLKKFNGNVESTAAIVKDVSSIQQAMAEGTNRVKSSPPMTIIDLFYLLNGVDVLQSELGELLDSLNLKKAELDKASAGPQILQILKEMRIEVDRLSSAVAGNMPYPSILGLMAGPFAIFVTARIDQGITQWTTAVTPKAAMRI